MCFLNSKNDLNCQSHTRWFWWFLVPLRRFCCCCCCCWLRFRPCWFRFCGLATPLDWTLGVEELFWLPPEVFRLVFPPPIPCCGPLFGRLATCPLSFQLAFLLPIMLPWKGERRQRLKSHWKMERSQLKWTADTHSHVSALMNSSHRTGAHRMSAPALVHAHVLRWHVGIRLGDIRRSVSSRTHRTCRRHHVYAGWSSGSPRTGLTVVTIVWIVSHGRLWGIGVKDPEADEYLNSSSEWVGDDDFAMVSWCQEKTQGQRVERRANCRVNTKKQTNTAAVVMDKRLSVGCSSAFFFRYPLFTSLPLRCSCYITQNWAGESLDRLHFHFVFHTKMASTHSDICPLARSFMQSSFVIILGRFNSWYRSQLKISLIEKNFLLFSRIRTFPPFSPQTLRTLFVYSGLQCRRASSISSH